jgi:hypothetical protein
MARLATLCAVMLAAVACDTTTAPDAVALNGTWGGDHAVLTISESQASIEFDCAHGELAVPITVNRGSFDVTGHYIQEHGGPIRSDDIADRQPARYTGTVDGRLMTLRVRLAAAAQDLATYTLTQGSSGRVFKCL